MLITFEGIDGAGKTTQILNLYEKLRQEGIKCYKFDMGSYPIISRYIQESKCPENKVSPPLREILYYFEGHLFSDYYRKQLLKTYEVVLCDRWLLTYFAYGMNNKMRYEEIQFFTKGIARPDICFYFDLSPEISAKRIRQYREFDWPEIGYTNEFPKGEGKNIENFLETQKKIKENFQKLIFQSDYTIEIIEAEDDKEIIKEIIYKKIKKAKEKEREK